MAEILAEDSVTIRCICGYDHDDNFTIQCERCNAWQHAMCVNITDESAVPEHYLCPECSGRTSEVDANKAREYQRLFRKRQLEYERLVGSNAGAQPGEIKVPRTRGRSRSSNNDINDSNSNSEGEGRNGIKSSDLTPPTTFNPNFYNVSTSANQWTEQARTLWDKIQQDTNVSHEVPQKLSYKEYVENPGLLKVARNERSQNQWILGLDASALVCNSNIPPNKIVCEVIGQVSTREEYASDPRNQYTRLGCPKAGVFFVPGQPFAIDARNHGSNALFIKRSAAPNAYLTAREDKKGRLRLFIATRKSVKAGTELNLGWHWPEDHPLLHYMEELAADPEAKPSDEVSDILWLLRQDINELGRSRKVPHGADEEWGRLDFDIIAVGPTLLQSKIQELEELPPRKPSVKKEPEDQLASVRFIWQPASECVTPPPKKRMSLADYRKKRT